MPELVDPRQAELELARQRVQQRFPRLGSFRFDVRSGTGEGFAEFFPPDESRSPNPGIATVEVRDPKLVGRALDTTLAGDMLHLLGGTTIDEGIPHDPEFRKLKETFAANFTPREASINRTIFEARRKQGIENRSFEQFMDVSMTDSIIRSHLFPDIPTPDGRPIELPKLSPTQVDVLQRMRQLLQEPKR